MRQQFRLDSRKIFELGHNTSRAEEEVPLFESGWFGYNSGRGWEGAGTGAAKGTVSAQHYTPLHR